MQAALIFTLWRMLMAGLVVSLVCVAPVLFAVAADAQPDDAKITGDLKGFWYTENKEAGIEIYECASKYCGRFYWLQPDAVTARDIKNPERDKRRQLLCKLQFMGGFTSDDHGHYIGGWIYNARTGQSYNASLSLSDPNTLKVRGYVLMPMLGGGQTWTRAETLSSCSEGSPKP